MRHIVFLLEELSARKLLEGLLPRLFPAGLEPRYIVFEGKSDLERQLVRRLRGYQVPDARFVVLRDQDSADCREIKGNLQAKCSETGRSVLVRIACHELESWYLGDLTAVESALGAVGVAAQQEKRNYRDPDAFPSPSATLKTLAPNYQKVGGSRALGLRLSLEGNRSKSYNAFLDGVRRLADDGSSGA